MSVHFIQCIYFKEGVKVGQRVLAISDPVNEGQMLSLESKPSKMALIRAMNLRNYPEVEMTFSSELPSVAAEIINNAGGGDFAVLAILPAFV